MTQLITLAFALLAGLLMSRLAKKLKLPAVTAYLVAGILVGPYVLGRLDIPGIGFDSLETVESFDVICQMALGFIAFEIGNEFRLSALKQTGKQTMVIGIVQAVATALLVDVVLIAIHLIWPEVLALETAIILGAIATATAPAATLMVVKQYKAKGKLTDMLLQVVALDDAVGLVVFAVSLGIAKAIHSGSISVVSILLQPVIEIVLSLVIGALLGLLLTWLENHFKSRSKRTGLVVCLVALAVGISLLKFEVAGVHVSFSTLLMLMAMGTIFCNTCKMSDYIMGMSERWAGVVTILFFVISGAELQFTVFSKISVILIGLAYIAARSTGKIVSSDFTAKLTKCDESIVKNLGITLLPQAGVALGMISIVATTFGSQHEITVIVTQVILMSVLIYELVGPVLTRMALQRAGDITSLEAGEEEAVLNQNEDLPPVEEK